MSPQNAVLSWSNISKVYGRKVLFRELTGELTSGKKLVVTGSNGAGKSTFLKIAAGLLSPDAGHVVRPMNREIVYCAPSLELYGDLTGAENLLFFARIAGIDQFDPDIALGRVGLGRSASKLYSSYSSGMKQRLKLAFATLMPRSLLILDEPTLALDTDGVKVVDSLIQSHCDFGGCALIASNDQSEADRWADLRLSIGSQAW